MQEQALENYKKELKLTLQCQLLQIQKQVVETLKAFENEIHYLIENKFRKLLSIKNLSEDYEEHMDNLKQIFQKGVDQIGKEIIISISQSLESHNLSQEISYCVKQINNVQETFDVYKFKYFNVVQPQEIQPKREIISQIQVLNKSLSALVYQNYQNISIINHNTYKIENTLFTPFVKKIISSNAASSTLCYKTDREIIIVNYHSRRIIRSFTINNNTDEMICACQLNKFIFAYATNFGRIWVVDITTGDVIAKLDGEIPSILFKFNNKYLIAAGITRGMNVWDWRKGIVAQRFIGHTSRINSVIKYDNDHIISCDQIGKICMFKLSTSIRCRQFIGHDKPVIKLVLLNQDFFASCSYDRTIRFWSIQSETCFRKLENHDNFVLDFAKFGNNKILSTCLDLVLNVWG